MQAKEDWAPQFLQRPLPEIPTFCTLAEGAQRPHTGYSGPRLWGPPLPEKPLWKAGQALEVEVFLQSGSRPHQSGGLPHQHLSPATPQLMRKLMISLRGRKLFWAREFESCLEMTHGRKFTAHFLLHRTIS
jgi:hypothetical protein